jgi:hypothetical protein
VVPVVAVGHLKLYIVRGEFSACRTVFAIVPIG